MTAYKAWPEVQEIPLCSRSLENGECIDSHLVENDGKLVHEGNIDIPLAVLNDLCRFCDLYALSPVDTGLYNKFVDFCDRIKSLFIHT